MKKEVNEFFIDILVVGTFNKLGIHIEAETALVPGMLKQLDLNTKIENLRGGLDKMRHHTK